MEKQYQLTLRFGINTKEEFKDFCKAFENIPCELLSHGFIEVEEK